MQITEITAIKAAKRPQSEWPKASTNGGPVVQVGNTPVLFVLIGNPISQSKDVFFSAITNNSSRCVFFSCPLVFSIYPNLLHAGFFSISESLLAQSAG